MPEAGLQVPGGTVKVEAGETPLQAVAREVLEESGLPLGGWEGAAAFEANGQRWHCFVTTPALVLPDTWRCEPLGRSARRGCASSIAGRPWRAGKSSRGRRRKRGGRWRGSSPGVEARGYAARGSCSTDRFAWAGSPIS